MTVKYRVLVSAPYMQPVIERFRHRFEERGAEIVLPRVTERLSESELLPLVGEIDGVVAGDDHFTARVLEKAVPRLKVLSKWGTGIDSFDREACRRLGVEIRNTPGAFTQPVTDSVMGYLLAFARKLPWMDAELKGGSWRKIPGRALAECVLGIVGVGNIGKEVARRARAFGMQVLGVDIVDMPREFLEESGIEMVTMQELLSRADFVSVNCDLNDTSRHLIDERALAQMKPEAVLLNLARGPIVDERHLVAALQAGRIAGAALDVFEHEPLPADSPLRTMSNVMLAPHNSNSSPRAWERVHDNTIRNLFDVLEEKAP